MKGSVPKRGRGMTSPKTLDSGQSVNIPKNGVKFHVKISRAKGDGL